LLPAILERADADSVPNVRFTAFKVFSQADFLEKIGSTQKAKAWLQDTLVAHLDRLCTRYKTDPSQPLVSPLAKDKDTNASEKNDKDGSSVTKTVVDASATKKTPKFNASGFKIPELARLPKDLPTFISDHYTSNIDFATIKRNCERFLLEDDALKSATSNTSPSGGATMLRPASDFSREDQAVCVPEDDPDVRFFALQALVVVAEFLRNPGILQQAV
jgi:hypothetical protein